MTFQFRFVLSACCLAAALLTMQSPVTRAADTQGPKNVILLLADDLGWGDVGFHGGIASTPNIDRLAQESLELNRFYAFPTCSSSRAALLTARYPGRFGITGPVKGFEVGMPATEYAIPAAFQQAGFATSLIGKWHLTGHRSGSNLHPNKFGFDYFYGFMGEAVDYYTRFYQRAGITDWQRNGQAVIEEGYVTDLLADDIIKRIKERGDKPFCLLASFSAPHNPFQAPKELIDKYSRQHGVRAGTYAAMIESLDIAVGRILKTIDSEKLRDNTVVVFASDNGAIQLGNNGPFSGVKRQVWEGGIHVPCMIRAPGLKPGQSKQLTAIYDLYPTLASACGVNVSSNNPLDGRDLWSALNDSQLVGGDVFIGEQDIAMIRDDWKLVASSRGTSLFNVGKDKSESNELSSINTDIADEMYNALTTFQQTVRNDGPGLAAAAKSNPKTEPGGEGSELASFELTGDVEFGLLGDQRVVSAGKGLRFHSAIDKNNDGKQFALASKWVDDVSTDKGRWYRLQVRGMAHEDFKVNKDALFLKVEFFKNKRQDSLDSITTRIYPQIQRERKDFADEGTNKNLGNASWRTYAMDFRTPFAEIDSFKLSVGFNEGVGSGMHAEFQMTSVDLDSIDEPQEFASRVLTTQKVQRAQPNERDLVHLGGRWYFDPRGKSRTVPDKFDYTNADQLLYRSARFERPFEGNMTSWLRPGHLDLAGETVTEDKFLKYNLVIRVTDKHVILNSKNIPNHPTASFPDSWRLLDGNSARIHEQANVHRLPIQPQINANHIAMDRMNENQALPMGAIGVATNGVVFFNPFDHILEADATWRLDRCCGHPSPQNAYHYHKYPVCVKTPWIDDGSGHSPVIGFAFDGFAVYGPYESEGKLAMDDQSNPLNDYNLHEDAQRGPHYHVTPGKFPHIIGGYWGYAERGRRGR